MSRLTTILLALALTQFAGFATVVCASSGPCYGAQARVGSDTCNANGNTMRLTQESVNNTSTRYDGLTPLGGTGGDLQGYDAVGNRRSRRSTMAGIGNATSNTPFDVNDRVDNDAVATTPSTLFDANGNQTSHGAWSYGYDFEDRLISAVNGGTSITMVYDGDGHRVRKSVASGASTWYLVDDRNLTGYAQVLEEQPSAGGTPTVTYTYGLDLVSQTGEEATTYYGYDGLGTVRYLSDGAGSVSDTYTYDAFGIGVGSSGAVVNSYRSSGEQWDADLGLYYLRARYYNPETGRFLTADTYEGSPSDPATLHKYLYCANDPVNYTDPSGQFVETEMAAHSLQKDVALSQSVAVMAAKQGAQRELIKSVTKLLATSMLLGVLSGDDDADSTSTSGRKIPTMLYSKAEFPVISQNIASAQLTGGKARLLHYIGPFVSLQQQQRRDALRPFRNIAPPSGNSWDEYPFASTLEGGSGAQVVAAPTGEQSRQGWKHSQFYLRHAMRMADPFFVKVVP